MAEITIMSRTALNLSSHFQETLRGEMLSSSSSSHHTDVLSVTFSLFSSEEIKKLSVLKIRTPLTFNALGHPLQGGLYDPALGPLSFKSDPCKTCLRNIYLCPGHLGHIELPVTVVNPLFYNHIYLILRSSCLACYAFQIPDHYKYLMLTQLRLLNAGYLTEAEDAEMIMQDLLMEDTNMADPTMISLLKRKLEEFESSTLSDKNPAAYDATHMSRNIEALRSRILQTSFKNTSFKQCKSCYVPIKKVSLYQNKVYMPVTKVEAAAKFSKDMKGNGPKTKSSAPGSTMIYPAEQRDHLRKIWENNKELIEATTPVLTSAASMEYPTDMLFIDVVPVTPAKIRPVNFVDNKMVEHPQTEIYKHIVQDSVVLRHILKVVQDESMDNLSDEGKMVVNGAEGKTPVEKLNFMLGQLQGHIDHLLDMKLNQSVYSGSHVTGIKQLIEKKNGVLRMNMMGKRVNYAARSVITPDPNLDIDEVGIPEAFAKTLTYPTYVSPINVIELREMIKNGPLVHPGANLIEYYDGAKIKLSPTDKAQREAIANKLLTPGDEKNSKGIKLVHRHLKNGDFLLINRQPTLHKPSIMAHKARILKGEKTLRLHYANCKAYNADFDGDEMNAHFPQNEFCRSEALNIVNVSNQYAVPKDGTPLSGLIQDHVIAGVRLSIRGRFFSRFEYSQLVYQALAHKKRDIRLLPPAILKPDQLWSGKQILSTILINTIPEGQHLITMSGKSKISSKAWEVGKARKWKAGGTKFSSSHTMSEGEVIIRNGELLCGVLDKMHYGATPYGLVHSLFELYGGSCSSSILSSLSKLFTYYLQKAGFTLGIEDILLRKEAERNRRNLIEECRKIGDAAVLSALELEEDSADKLKDELEEFYASDEKATAIIDHSYKVSLDGFTNSINKTCMPEGLLRKFPENNLQLMIQSGAKGSTVNAMQISCLLGQIELEGKRPPRMKSQKSLPSFRRLDTSPRAGGFIDGRFLTGILPQEFFFHCMAGREGLIDTACKTSRSGYLQRCLIKHLEGLVVHYDHSVRDSDGSIIQYCYGEDGRDVLKAQFLSKDHIPFLVENHKAIIPQNEEDIDKLKVDSNTEKGINKHRKKIEKWIAKHGPLFQKYKVKPFQEFSISCYLDPKPSTRIRKKSGRSKFTDAICKSWYELEPDVKKGWEKNNACPDPVTAKYRADVCFGALTEQLEFLMRDYLENRPSGVVDCETSWNMIKHKSILSMVHPGEPVGILAAQSIGEPSTQMTLNTFHFAGRGEMNVTLGIPRLVEILMHASKDMKTPSMDIPFKPGIRNLKSKAEKLCKKLTRVTVNDVLERAVVSEYLNIGPVRERTYVVKLEFSPRSTYKSDFIVTPHSILQHIEKKFIKHVLEAIKRVLNFRQELFHFDTTKQQKQGAEDEDDDAIDDQESKKTNVAADDSSDEESEAGEEEDAKKQSARQVEDYDSEGESEEDEAEELEEENDVKEDKSEIVKTEEYEMQEGFEGENFSKEDLDKYSPKFRCRSVLDSSKFIKNYVYDTKNELWCEVTIAMPLERKRIDMSNILKEVTKKSVISHVPKIRRGFTYVNPDTQLLTLKTDGINIQSMYQYSDLLDVNKLYSSDIYQVSQHYGIEAARKVIIKEVQNVFKMYGIIVDPRHLLLVADYMTYSGSFDPLSRKGLQHHTSSLQQMSFEASLGFLKTATLRSRCDTLKSPSSRIMVGRPCLLGTGMCSVVQKLTV